MPCAVLHFSVPPRVLLTLLFISTFPCLNFLDDGLTFPRGKHQRKNNSNDSVLSCSDSAPTTFLLCWHKPLSWLYDFFILQVEETVTVVEIDEETYEEVGAI
jgi:hypothetical protein